MQETLILFDVVMKIIESFILGPPVPSYDPVETITFEEPRSGVQSIFNFFLLICE